ncbi:putative CBF1 interacting corepressor [Blattamonas nauphoetae]|nr:putative CBF1 interacting corepressor [Blattamonas nauphoetae]
MVEKRDKELIEIRRRELEKEAIERAQLGELDPKARRRKELSFMYEAPPGYVEPKTADDEEEKEEETAGIGAAFPQAIAGKNAPLEEKFASYKVAPTDTEYGRQFSMTHHPFGEVIKEIKCHRCGQWGHQTGDRECPLRFINPRDALRKEMEDPMTFMMQKESEMKTEITKQKRAHSSGKSSDAVTSAEPLSYEQAERIARLLLSRLDTGEKEELVDALLNDVSSSESSDESEPKKHRKSSHKSRHHHSSRRSHSERSHRSSRHCKD